MKKRNEMWDALGLDPKKEYAKLFALEFLLIAIGIGSYLYLRRIFILPGVTIFALVFGFFYFSRYDTLLKEKEQRATDQFVESFTYFSIYISNGYNVYRALEEASLLSQSDIKPYFDELLDSESHNPGSKIIEKQTAGVYLGELVHLMIEKAAEDGIISEETLIKLRSGEKISSALIDSWAFGNGLDKIFSTTDEAEFVKDISLAVIDRSARCMCSLLLAIAKCTGRGGTEDRPVCDFAEGSLVQKSLNYRPLLEKYLAEYGEKTGKKVKLLIGSDSTLPGAGAASLLNC